MLRRLSERLKQHTWLAVGIDLVVVVLGILIALQLDGWAERREERRLERVYLQRLAEDFEIERSRMEAAERFANARIEAARFLNRILSDPQLAAAEPARVPWALETSTWRSFPQINAFVYRELQSTGRLVLLRSESLRRSLAEHYTALQHDARVGEDLIAQQRFDHAVAGLLTIEELEAVERAAGDYRQLKMSSGRAVAVARSLARRHSAIDELPSLVQHHTFNLRVISAMRRRADEILKQIDSLTAGKANRERRGARPNTG
jgi:hypothetical protein